MMDWLSEDKELHGLVIKAFRYVRPVTKLRILSGSDQSPVLNVQAS